MVPEMLSGTRNPQLVEERLDREDGGLGVQHVEDSLDEKISTPPSARPWAASPVGLHELIERDRPCPRVVDVGRHRGGLVGRPEGAGHKAGLVRDPAGGFIGGGAGEPGGGDIKFDGTCFHPVVGQADAVGVEGVGLDDVRAGLKVLAVDVAYDVRTGEGQQVVVALQVTGEWPETLAAVVSPPTAGSAGSWCPWLRRGS